MIKKCMYVGLLVLTVFVLGGAPRFETLTQWSAHAAKHIEAPPLDNGDWFDPDFSSFYATLEPTLFGRIFALWGLYDPDLNFYRIKRELVELTKKRASLVQKTLGRKELLLTKGARVFIWGDLHGSYFSLIRAFQKLKNDGIIDEFLRVQKPCDYIVFLGDVINRSPYTFFLLEFIFALMEKNPKNVLYLRGHQETDRYWENFFAMRKPLERFERVLNKSRGGEISLKEEFNTFFETLPGELILKKDGGQRGYVLCKHEIPPMEALINSQIKALITGEQRNLVSWQTKGLDFLGFIGGVPSWGILSCPNRLYGEFMNFYNDSFICVLVGETLEQSSLSFFYQDRRQKNGFKKELFCLTQGLPLEDMHQECKKEALSFGTLVSFSGAVGSVGRGICRGITAALSKNNQKKGFPFIRPIVFDDGYVPRRAVVLLDALLNDYHLNVCVGSQGTPTLNAYLDKVKAGKVWVFFPATGGQQFRLPELTHLIHYRQSYPQEARALVNHIITTYSSRLFAILYQNDVFGIQLANAAQEVFRERGIKNALVIPFAREQTELKEQIKKLKSMNVEAIGFFLTSTTMLRNFITSVGIPFFLGSHLFGLSFLDDAAFRQFLKAHGLRFTFSYPVPDPVKSNLPLVEEFRIEMDKHHYPYDSNTLEGYISGALVRDALEVIGFDAGPEKLMHYFESLKNFSYKGFTLTFNPQTRSFEFPLFIRNERNKWHSISVDKTGTVAAQEGEVKK